MAGPERQPHGMWNDDAHEADQATDRDGGRCSQRRGEHDDHADLARFKAEGLCFFVTDGQHIQSPPIAEDDAGSEQEIRHHQHHLGPAARCDPAKDPGVHLSKCVGVGLQDIGLRCGQEARNGNAGEDEGCRRPAADVSCGVRQHHGEQCPTEGRQRDRVGEAAPVTPVLGDRHCGAETGACSDAKQVGIGERIAERSLIRGAAHGQRRTDEKAEHHAGQPDLFDDGDPLRRQARVEVDEG